MATIDMEQLDGVVGCFCTLLYPRRGQTEGTIVEDLGCEVIVQLINGKEVTEYKDDVVICESFATSCSELWAMCSELCSAERDETTSAVTAKRL